MFIKPKKKFWVPQIAPYYAVSGSTPFSITNTVNSNNIAGAATTFTYNTQNIGTANATRIIVVAVTGGINNVSITGITVGGNAATQTTNTGAAGTPTNPNTINDIWYYADGGALGTSTTIVVTYASSQSRNAICVYSVLGTGAAFSSSAHGNGGGSAIVTANVVATVPAGGGAILIFGNHTSVTGFTSTNWTVDLPFALYGTSGVAAGHTTSASGSTTFTANWTTNSEAILSVATFSP